MIRLRPRASLLTGYPAALLLIAAFYALALYASTFNSQTFDEGAHLAGGYIHLTLGHPRIHTENGYLSQAIVALPLLLIHPNLPSQSGYAFIHAQPFNLGREFLFDSYNNFAQILLLGRAAIGLLTAITAFTLYTWSRKLFSPLAGLFSLLVFLLSPLVLAHGFLATSDMPVTCFFLLSLAAFNWTLQRITPTRFLLTALALTALFLSKMSAPLILPVLAALAFIDIMTPVALGGGKRWGHRAVRNLTLLLTQALATYFLIWLTYHFTYSAFKDSPPDLTQTFAPLDQWTWALQNPNLLLRTIAFARTHHLLPESYLYGYAYVLQTGRVVVSFANGTPSATGWWWFYPYVFLLTTPLPILALLLLATARLFKKATTPVARSRRGHRARHLLLTLKKTAPLTLFILTYALAAILSYRGSGPRHLLPIFPMLCILLGALVTPMLRPAPFQNLSFRIYNFPHALVPLLLLWLALENALLFPHYISSVNELAGGPKNAYHFLVDSALDWGQDLPALATFLHKNAPRPDDAYFSYFGSADPAAYGIHATTLPSFLGRNNKNHQPLHPAYYCISATTLQNLYNENAALAGPYTPALEKDYQAARLDPYPHRLHDLEFLRLCAFLRKHTPDAQAGYSINIYRLTTADLTAALDSPPPYSR